MFRHKGKYSKYKNKHKSAKSYTTNFTNNNIEVGKKLCKTSERRTCKSKHKPGYEYERLHDKIKLFF